MTPPAWLSRLLRPGRAVGPVPGKPGWYGIYPGGDRRRRCEARFTADALREALAQGWIRPDDEEVGRFEAEPEAAAALRRANLPEGAQFSAQHRRATPRAVIDEGGRLRSAVALEDTTLLARQARAGRLSAVQRQAGERLQMDYDRAAFGGRLTCDWTRGPGAPGAGRGSDPADAPAAALDARARVMDALTAVGPGLDRVLTAIVLRDRGMAETERALGWPKRSGLAALRMALDRLAAHYGLVRPPRPEAALLED